jgi:hypothetical protein
MYLLWVSHLENRLAKVLALEHRHKGVGRLVDALVDVLFAGDAAVREPLSSQYIYGMCVSQ